MKIQNQKYMNEEGIKEVATETQKNLAIDHVIDASKSPDEIVKELCRYYLE